MNIMKIRERRAKRVGRGFGSGKGGHTVGRGVKGQKSRSGGRPHILFEGTKFKKSLLRRLPKLRGKGKFKAASKPVTVTLADLNVLPEGSEITVSALEKAGIIGKKEAVGRGVKILDRGKLERKLVLKVPASSGATEKIKNA